VPTEASKSMLPTKLKVVLMVSFCLMSLIPMLSGVYAMSLLMRSTAQTGQLHLFTISVVAFFGLLTAYLGFLVIKQLLMPLIQVKEAAERIASGRLEHEPSVIVATDEIQDLAQSLNKISRNAIELLEKVDRLSLKDRLTGLYNTTYIRERLNEEIQRAIHYQRPCSFAYIAIRDYEQIASKLGEEASEGALKKMAGILSGQLCEFDRAARIGRGEFAVIFPDKNKKKCIELIEKIGHEAPKDLSVCAGISENPIDGVHADSLYVKAQDRMKAAHASGKLLDAFI